MNENLARKTQIVEEVHTELSAASFAVLAQYRGVDVANMNALRRNAREANVQVRVVKNTLARRAAENTEFACLTDHFVGPVAIASSQDVVAAAKAMVDFAKDAEQFEIRIGAMNGQLITSEQVAEIAKLPGREELLGKLVGTLAAPIQKLLGTLNEVPSKFARTLVAIKDAKGESAQSAE